MQSISDPAMEQAQRTDSSARTHTVIALSVLTLALIALYRDTASTMLDAWLTLETYRYGLIVFPVFFWLLWRQRSALLAASWVPAWWALPIVLLSGAAWTFGEIAGARALSQLALVSMFAGALVATFGVSKFRIALFPMAFLLFAVPVGEELIPTLMDWTAHATVVALRWSGVPVFREGLWFIVPTGTWSVIEACSGVKFLLTASVVGSLLGYLMYRSPLRRLAFFGAAVLVALLANWLRAYLTVLIGHLSHNRLMSQVGDHNLLSWPLFGSVIVALVLLGGRYAQSSQPCKVLAVASAPRWPVAVAATLALTAAAIWPQVQNRLELLTVPLLPEAAPLVATQNGWQEVPDRISTWTPSLLGASQLTVQVFEKESKRIELHVATFEQQREGAEMASSANRLVSGADRNWKVAAIESTNVEAPGFPPRVQSARLHSARKAYVIWHWMVSASGPTMSALQGKMDVMHARLSGRPDRAFWVAAIIEVDETVPAVADATLHRFAHEMGEEIARALTTWK